MSASPPSGSGSGSGSKHRSTLSASLNSNILKSLTSVHLPPPPSSGSSNDQQPPQTPGYPDHKQHQTLSTPLSFSLSQHTPPPSATDSKKAPATSASRTTSSSATATRSSASSSLVTPLTSNRQINQKTRLRSKQQPPLESPLAARDSSSEPAVPPSSKEALAAIAAAASSSSLAPSSPISSGASKNTLTKPKSSADDEMLHHQGFLYSHSLPVKPSLVKFPLDPGNKENAYPQMQSFHVPPIVTHQQTSYSSYSGQLSGQQQFAHQKIAKTNTPSTASSTSTAASNAPRDQEIPRPDEMPPIYDDGSKPPYSYATLIGMAILRSPERKLTLSQIYKWINDTFEWYRKSKSGWQNSIRHNLSLNKAFRKQERPKSDPGKGNYWMVEAGCEFQFVKGRTVKRPNNSNNAPIQPPAPATKSTSESDPASSLQSLSVTSTSVAMAPSNSVFTLQHPPRPKSTTPELSSLNTINPLSTYPSYDTSDPALTNPTSSHVSFSTSDDFISTSLSPLKRSKTAIGLQHFSKTTLDVESPTKKRGVGAIDVSVESSNSAEITTPNGTKRRRFNSYAPFLGSSLSSATSISDATESPSHVLDPDRVPSLIAPPTSWLPFTSVDDGSGVCMTPIFGSSQTFEESQNLDSSQDTEHSALDNGLMLTSDKGKLGPAITLNRNISTPAKSGITSHPALAHASASSAFLGAGPKLFSPSPFKKGLGSFNPLGFASPVAYEFEDVYPYSPIRSSPSRSRSALGFGSSSSSFNMYSSHFAFPTNDEELKAFFGSPDKRGFMLPPSSSGSDSSSDVMFNMGSHYGVGSVGDVFGVDVCQVVKRAVELKEKNNKGLLTPTGKKFNSRHSLSVSSSSNSSTPISVSSTASSITVDSVKEDAKDTKSEMREDQDDKNNDDTEDEEERPSSPTHTVEPSPSKHAFGLKKVNSESDLLSSSAAAMKFASNPHHFLAPTSAGFPPSASKSSFQSPSKFQFLELRNLDAERFLHYDSPIKTQSSIFSPQRRDRPDYY